MTDMQIPTIWDHPLPMRQARAARRQRLSTERFVTFSSRPEARLAKKSAQASRARRLPRFYI